MKNKILLSALAIAMLSPLAQAQLNVNINGRINALTCDIASANGEKTIDMREISITDITTNQEVDGNQTDNVQFRCPASNTVKVTMTDGGSTPNANDTPYLSNTRDDAGDTEAKAGGVGVKLYVKVGASGSEQLLTVGQEKTLRPKNPAASAYTQMETLTFVLHPKYWRFGSPTPGVVRSKAILTFEYD